MQSYVFIFKVDTREGKFHGTVRKRWKIVREKWRKVLKQDDKGDSSAKFFPFRVIGYMR